MTDVEVESGLASAPPDLALVGDAAWREAERRAAVIRPLARLPECPRDRLVAAADDLGLSVRQVHRLVRRCREVDGALTALLPGRSSGGRGGTRLSAAGEAVLHEVIAEVYLTRQRVSAEALVREVRRACVAAGVRPPSASTVRRRLAALDIKERRRRGDIEEPRAVSGRTPEARFPLDVVQMDHTKVDLILVDPVERAPIGPPWVTLAIDVHSRCIAGFHLSPEAPCATSVGLCLTDVASPKAERLAALEVEADWPVAGVPGRLGVDNGREFHSAAFERGCAEHGIAIDWRPPGRPHYGGIVERVIGTLMELVHGLPGTTFSNVSQRGAYDSDRAACLTLGELERWLAVAIAKFYHLRPHEGLDGEMPLACWRRGVEAMTAEGRSLVQPRERRRFLIDFLPVHHRTLRRDGIVLDHVTYFSDALRPLIQGGTGKDASRRVLVRRDPRDLSRVFVRDPHDGGYLEVPYRDLSHAPITLFEHRLARRRLRARRRAAVDERAIFAAVEEMREIERTAAATTRSARRNRARRAGLRLVASDSSEVPVPQEAEIAAADRPKPRQVAASGPARPFAIEEW